MVVVVVILSYKYTLSERQFPLRHPNTHTTIVNIELMERGEIHGKVWQPPSEGEGSKVLNVCVWDSHTD